MASDMRCEPGTSLRRGGFGGAWLTPAMRPRIIFLFTFLSRFTCRHVTPHGSSVIISAWLGYGYHQTRSLGSDRHGCFLLLDGFQGNLRMSDTLWLCVHLDRHCMAFWLRLRFVFERQLRFWYNSFWCEFSGYDRGSYVPLWSEVIMR